MKERVSFPCILAGLLLAAGCQRAPQPLPLISHEHAMREAAATGLGAIKEALRLYYLDVGGFPTTDEGLKALLQPAKGRDGKLLGGPWLAKDSMLVDPWGTPFQYAYPGTHNKDFPDVWSNGPDKQPNTADDIGNWQD